MPRWFAMLLLLLGSLPAVPALGQTSVDAAVDAAPIREVITRQMVTDLASDLGEVKTRVNAMLWLMVGAVAVNVTVAFLGTTLAEAARDKVGGVLPLKSPMLISTSTYFGVVVLTPMVVMKMPASVSPNVCPSAIAASSLL